MGKHATKRINITFPVSLLEDLGRYTPRRKRNEFIVKATEAELKRERLLQALSGSAGAWSDEDHPDLMTLEAVDRYVRRLRETWVPQNWDEFEKLQLYPFNPVTN